MNSRIRTPFYIFLLNPDNVAARSLRSLQGSYLIDSSKRLQDISKITIDWQKSRDEIKYYVLDERKKNILTLPGFCSSRKSSYQGCYVAILARLDNVCGIYF